MRAAWTSAVCAWLVVACCHGKPTEPATQDMELLMPGVQPTEPDTYLCLPKKVEDGPLYITGFMPHANMSTAHHILLFGCEEPGNSEEVWNCGEMESATTADSAPPCMTEPKILYAWAMDAPDLKLPKDVGFKVGGNTDVQWLVLQVHYKDVSHFLPPENKKDESGLTLTTTTQPQPRRAGVYLLSTGGEIPAHSTTYMEAACSVDDTTPIHPFAFRVHAHTHGEVVSGYRVRDGQWTEIGRKSPKDPQMFYSVTTPDLTIEKGDLLAARCTMVNDENRNVLVGPTQQDEMCNFYVMYWMPGDETMDETYCTTAGPPSWSWRSTLSTIDLDSVPGDVSKIPGTDTVLEASRIMQQVDNALDNARQGMEAEWTDLLGGDRFNGAFDREMGGLGGNPEDSLRDLLYRVEAEEEARDNEVDPMEGWYRRQARRFDDDGMYYPQY